MARASKKPPQLSAPQTIVASFLIVILIGTLILMLPVCSAEGTWTSPIDALFTATTSVCVTGLTTVTTAFHWSLFGKLVILLLIQLGGLGVITVFSAFILLTGQKLMLRENVLIQEQYNLDSAQGMGKLIKRVMLWAFAIEGIGAVGYMFVFIPDPEYGILRGIWYSLFHAISAFCNAGIDLIGDSSLAPYVHHPIVNVVTEAMIILGSIGFVVLWDTKQVIADTIKGKYKPWQIFDRLTLHSKLAYTITLILLAGGFILILAMEWNNPDTIGSFSVVDKIQAAWFQSVTTRTAGMATIPQQNFRNETILVSMILMFIGGSPMGTAGGVKTTTIGIVLLTVLAQIIGRHDTEVYGRKISADNIRTALSVVIFSAFGHVMAILLILITRTGGFLETVFEVVSALGTVGLTMGMTGQLNVFGRLVIIVAMFFGRIGPITIAVAFSLQKKKYKKLRELPEKRIIIG